MPDTTKDMVLDSDEKEYEAGVFDIRIRTAPASIIAPKCTVDGGHDDVY